MSLNSSEDLLFFRKSLIGRTTREHYWLWPEEAQRNLHLNPLARKVWRFLVHTNTLKRFRMVKKADTSMKQKQDQFIEQTKVVFSVVTKQYKNLL